MTNKLPRVYLASKLRHAPMWNEWRKELNGTLDIISTWHDNPDVKSDDKHPTLAEHGWRRNRRQILYAADHLLAYANAREPINGTLVEIGMALAMDIPVHLVGTYAWGSWHHLPSVTLHGTLHQALITITSWDETDRSQRRIGVPHDSA